jgi:hypothetical protein
MNLYEEYNRVRKDNNLEDKLDVLNKIVRENPKLIDYLFNKVDSCYGNHRVYVVQMKVHETDMIKIGYTKNTIEGRFSEKRYSGRDKIELIDVYRACNLQAKGAVDFEKELKSLCKEFSVKTELTLPGKGEFYDISYKDDILKLYDKHIEKHKNTIGLKPPN